MDDWKLVAAVYVDLSEVFNTIGYSFVDVTRGGDKRFLTIFWKRGLLKSFLELGLDRKRVVIIKKGVQGF